jgi:hypothetical protein
MDSNIKKPTDNRVRYSSDLETGGASQLACTQFMSSRFNNTFFLTCTLQQYTFKIVQPATLMRLLATSWTRRSRIPLRSIAETLDDNLIDPMNFRTSGPSYTTAELASMMPFPQTSRFVYLALFTMALLPMGHLYHSHKKGWSISRSTSGAKTLLFEEISFTIRICLDSLDGRTVHGQVGDSRPSVLRQLSPTRSPSNRSS